MLAEEKSGPTGFGQGTKSIEREPEAGKTRSEEEADTESDEEPAEEEDVEPVADN